MANSLQDQLRQAGLVNAKKQKKAEKALRAKEAQQRKGNAPAEDDAEAIARKAMAEKQARDRELNRQRDEAARANAIAAQVRQLITMNRLPKDGDVAYNFVDGKAVKRLHVGAKQQDQLVRGQLGIARLGSGDDATYELLPRGALEKIRERAPGAVVVCNEPGAEAEDEDDWYKDFKVPDDLMW